MRGRTRSKGPNPLTRSYESNGPDVKIRGTAQHVADKYAQLARDAQASGDPVSAENYFQHAEHYYRMISAAQEAQRQQYGGFQRPFDEDGEEGDEEAGAGFGMQGGGQQGPQQGSGDEYGEAGYPPPAYEPRPGGQNQNRYDRNDRNDRQNRPQQRFDRNNGSYDRGGDRNGGGDRSNGGYDRNGGGDRQEQRYDRNERFDRNDRNDRQDRSDRPDRNFGGERGGYDRQQGQGAGDRAGAERQNGERAYQDRNDRQNGERPYQDRNDRRERYQRDGRQDRGDYRGGQHGRGESRYGEAEVVSGEPEAGNLPAFLTTPVRQQIAVEAEASGAEGMTAHEAGANGEAAGGEATGIKTRRRRTRKADPMDAAAAPDLLEGTADPEA